MTIEIPSPNSSIRKGDRCMTIDGESGYRYDDKCYPGFTGHMCYNFAPDDNKDSRHPSHGVPVDYLILLVKVEI